MTPSAENPKSHDSPSIAASGRDWKQVTGAARESRARETTRLPVTGITPWTASAFSASSAWLTKIATYAAQVARAQALGFDPELLRLSADEADTAMLAQARMAVASGKPVWLIDSEGVTRLD